MVVLVTVTVLSGAARGWRGDASARVAEKASSTEENNMTGGPERKLGRELVALLACMARIYTSGPGGWPGALL